MSLIFPLIRFFGLLLFGWGRSQQRCFVKVTSKKSSLIYAEPSVASTSPTVAEGWTWFVTVTKCCLSTEQPKVFNPPHHYTSRSYWYRDPGFHIVYIKSSAHREPADRAASFLSSPIWYRVSCCWLSTRWALWLLQDSVWCVFTDALLYSLVDSFLSAWLLFGQQLLKYSY